MRQQFTAKERDIETGLDYFKARYYSATQGRFLSVDPKMKSASIGDPQSFNRYTYALNNPTTIDDPDGMCPKGKKCYKDDKGYEYYDDEDGNPVAVTEVVDATPVIIFSVTVVIPQQFEIVYRSTNILRPAPRPVPAPPTRGLGFFGKIFGGIGIILSSPVTTGCGASPGMVSDGNGGCTRMSTEEQEPDTSANPDPEDNKPDTSENKPEEKKKGSKEKPVRDIIPGGLKTSRSYHSELENLTVSELEKLAKHRGEKGQRAKKMLKLAKGKKRLKGKGY